MNIIKQNGLTVATGNNKVVVNGKGYKKPGKGNNSTIINGEVYINGFELINGKWKRTLKAIWHLLF